MNGIPNIEGGRRFVTVKQLVQLKGYGWLSENALRHLLFAAKPRRNSRGEEIPGNGLSVAVRKIGRKTIIDVDQFDGWIDAQRVDRP